MKRQETAFSLSIAVLTAMLGSCANPTAAIQPDIDRFKRDYPNQIQSFQGKTKKLTFAWSGDPKKRAILFVHGSPGSWEGWAHFLLNSDLQKNFQLFAIDRPGYGGSEKGITEPSLQVQADSILEVLEFNQSHLPAILVGHSFGGPVVAKAAMDHPEKVAGLVLVASSVAPELEKKKWIQYPASWWPIRVLIPTALRVCNEEILPLKEELIRMLPGWKNISAKVVILQGADDALVPPGNLDFLLAHLNPEIVVEADLIPGLNHFVPWKKPELIVEAINRVNHAIR
jgi:pimeloyl-ACP methyl ester carboxylesterase